MDTKEYKLKCLVTEPSVEDYKEIGKRASEGKNLRLLHAGIGMATESGEILDQLKKHVFYGKELDTVNLMEECGDLLWYISVMLDACDYEYDHAMKKNIEKLMARFGSKFSKQDAIDRDLHVERDILESQ